MLRPQIFFLSGLGIKSKNVVIFRAGLVITHTIELNQCVSDRLNGFWGVRGGHKSGINGFFLGGGFNRLMKEVESEYSVLEDS